RECPPGLGQRCAERSPDEEAAHHVAHKAPSRRRAGRPEPTPPAAALLLVDLAHVQLLCGTIRRRRRRGYLVEPIEREPAEEVVGPASRRDRTRLWAAALRANSQQLARRAQIERGRHRSVDAVFEMVDRDSEVGGGIIAGALAYRLFIWLLPLALVAVAGLGFAADAASTSPEEAAESLGIEGLVSSSITNAAESPNRWHALLIGIPVLLWTTRSLLRVLIGAHRLVWSDVRAATPQHNPPAPPP